MLGNEQGTAILIGLDRDLVGADASGEINNLDLVVADERTQDRHVDGARNDIDVFDCLRRHLSDAVTGHQNSNALPSSNLSGNPHHVSPVENDASFDGS